MSLDKPERFSRLSFPIHKVDYKTVAELYKAMPGLRRYFQDAGSTPSPYFQGRGEMQLKVIKYIIYVYDEGTDLTDEYPDDTRIRKEAAAKEAGFKRDTDGNWPQDVQDILDFKEPVVVEWTLQYLKTQKSQIWREIKIIEEELDGMYRARAETVKSGSFSSKNDFLQMTKDRMELRDTLYKKFYAEHGDLKAATEKELIPISPENVFKVMEFPKYMTEIMQIKDVPEDARYRPNSN